MTRDENMTHYEAVRASCREIIALAGRSLGPNDLKHAGGQLGVLARGKFMIDEYGPGLRMIHDVAFFERNEKGVRPFDRFLAGPARALPAGKLAMAQSLGASFFSLFRFSAKHDTTGIWIEDVLDGNRRIWIISATLEGHEDRDKIFGMRIMDTGGFHIAVGPVAQARETIAEDCAIALAVLGRLPFARPLAAAVYGLVLTTNQPDHQSKAKLYDDLARGFKVIDRLKTSTRPSLPRD